MGLCSVNSRLRLYIYPFDYDLRRYTFGLVKGGDANKILALVTLFQKIGAERRSPQSETTEPRTLAKDSAHARVRPASVNEGSLRRTEAGKKDSKPSKMFLERNYFK